MTQVPNFPEQHIEALAHLLGECGTGGEINSSLEHCGLEDNSHENTKWRRLNRIFLDYQREYRCANHVISFIKDFMNPVRFVGRKEEFETHREKLNEILAFSGLKFGPDGQFRKTEIARTLDEAEKRLKTIETKFKYRRIHPEVYKYCRTELLQDNYFHAVFEATKGLAERIREISGVQADGSALVDKVFSIDRPLIAFNALQTETERSEHIGFTLLLRGCFKAIRNPLAHEPKIIWKGEDDAADYLSLISLLHWKLDDCFQIQTSFTQ